MSKDVLRYDLMVQDALKGVVRKILTEAARDGLPGEHHFYVTFRTGAPGVRLSQRLREKHPDEMTIVLQHQYWDLIIREDDFEVTVSFNKLQERIKVPFAALSAFVDPSVRFGLQFDRRDKETGEKVSPEKPEGASEPTPLPVPEKRPAPPVADGETVGTEGEAGEAPKPEDAASKVVKLDSFRKK